MPRTRILAGVLTATLLLAGAGCGGSDKTPDAAPTKATPAAKSEDVAAFVTRLTDAMAAKRTAKLELELGSSMSATADVDYAESGTSMAMKMITGSQAVRLVLADGAMYLQQTKGAKYLKIGKDDPSLGALLSQVSDIGPKSALEKVKSGIEKVRALGPETVDGEKLDHYELTIDTAKVSTLFGVPGGTKDTPKTLIYDVWVDGDFLLRQVKMTVAGQKLAMKASDWGKPVTIAAPPASQVVTR